VGGGAVAVLPVGGVEGLEVELRHRVDDEPGEVVVIEPVTQVRRQSIGWSRSQLRKFWGMRGWSRTGRTAGVYATASRACESELRGRPDFSLSSQATTRIGHGAGCCSHGGSERRALFLANLGAPAAVEPADLLSRWRGTCSGATVVALKLTSSSTAVPIPIRRR
jgi:hypothetical protein